MDTVIFACVLARGARRSPVPSSTRWPILRKARALSAGTQPGARVHPVVVEVMQEVGIDLTQQHPRRLTNAISRGEPRFDHDGMR